MWCCPDATATADGDVTIPVVHSSVGYAFLSNLPSTGGVEFNRTGSFWRHDTVLQADMWVATTSDSPPHAKLQWSSMNLEGVLHELGLGQALKNCMSNSGIWLICFLAISALQYLVLLLPRSQAVG